MPASARTKDGIEELPLDECQAFAARPGAKGRYRRLTANDN